MTSTFICLCKNVRLLVLTILVSNVATFSNAQVVVGENIPIPIGVSSYTFENQWAQDPRDHNHLVGTILTTCPDTVKNCLNTFVTSSDGGKNWTYTRTPAGADPWCVIDPKGNLCVSYIYGANYVLGMQTSADNGKTWSKELVIGSGYDHDMLVVDDSGGPMNGSMYLVATQSLRPDDQDPFVLVGRSVDGGKTFESRNHFHPFRNVDLNAKTPVILSDGTLSIPIVVRGQFREGDNKATPIDYQHWLINSTDGGKTFSSPKFVTASTGRGHDVLAVNKHNRFRDQLYYIYSGAEHKGIYCTVSPSKGESWSAPLRIDRNPNTSYNIVGSVAVNSVNGSIGVLYNERHSAGPRPCYDLYFAVSKDGGRSFSEPVKVNSQSSCPDENQGWFVRAWPQGGDYCGLVARPDGNFLAMWSDARTGSFRLYQATVGIR